MTGPGRRLASSPRRRQKHAGSGPCGRRFGLSRQHRALRPKWSSVLRNAGLPRGEKETWKCVQSRFKVGSTPGLPGPWLPFLLNPSALASPSLAARVLADWPVVLWLAEADRWPEASSIRGRCGAQSPPPPREGRKRRPLWADMVARVVRRLDFSPFAALGTPVRGTAWTMGLRTA